MYRTPVIPSALLIPESSRASQISHTRVAETTLKSASPLTTVIITFPLYLSTLIFLILPVVERPIEIPTSIPLRSLVLNERAISCALRIVSIELSGFVSLIKLSTQIDLPRPISNIFVGTGPVMASSRIVPCSTSTEVMIVERGPRVWVCHLREVWLVRSSNETIEIAVWDIFTAWHDWALVFRVVLLLSVPFTLVRILLASKSLL